MNREIIYGAILGLAVVGAVSMTARSHSNQGRSWRERIAYYPSAETLADTRLELTEAESAVLKLTTAPVWGADVANRLALNLMEPEAISTSPDALHSYYMRIYTLSAIADRFRAGAPIDPAASDLLITVLAREIRVGATDYSQHGKHRAMTAGNCAAFAGLLPDEPLCADALRAFAAVDAEADSLMQSARKQREGVRAGVVNDAPAGWR